MKTINTRRSIRKYSDKEVTDGLLNRLLAEAARTQTMGNMQLYSVVVTRSQEMKERLAPAHFNQPMVTQTFCNLAEEEGLGLCFLGTTVYQPQALIDVLQLPELVMPVATLTVGWPAEEPPLTDRLPLESFVHDETYHDYSPEDIDRYYGPKEALEENREFVRINNKETLAQIFTDIRYTKKDNESMSAGMMEALKRQGFVV